MSMNLNWGKFCLCDIIYDLATPVYSFEFILLIRSLWCGSVSISFCKFAVFEGHCYCFLLQAKKSKESLKEVTHKVYFDVEIDGKPAGML